ncbi:MAG: threonine ammonia-lyase [Pelagibacterales bacterium]|nr:threonine ammonia-lyase [Pelagibacterales bacterium]|tara:strand:- start:11303 stop:12514 length:1212 start_codon:yes stop_codon:yes gene_type:complete
MTISHLDIIKANSVINKYIINTETSYSHSLSELTDCHTIVKYENKQHTGSFKIRGALNKMLSLNSKEKDSGVVAMSAGNHSQGVAYSAKLMGIKSTIVMPDNTPFAKIRKTTDLGAEVIIHGNTLIEAEAFVDSLVETRSLTKIHPYNDAQIISGQGTLVLEMLEKHKDLDFLLVPVGGGGLIAGTSIMAKHLNKNIKVIGVQTELYPSLHNIFNKGKNKCQGTTLAEGIAVQNIGSIPLSIIKNNVDDVILVTEKYIEEGVSRFLLNDKTVAEGAGAIGLAALLQYKEKFKSKKVGILLCGGNIDSRVLSSVLMRDLVRKGQIITLSIAMADKPGQLGIISKLCSKEKVNILGVEHSRFTLDLSVSAARLEITLETRNNDHAESIIKKIELLGFSVIVKNVK